MFGDNRTFLWTGLATATLPPLLPSTPGPILLISVDLLLLSSLFPLLPPQKESWPSLCPALTAHLWLFWCHTSAVSSSACIYSSFSCVRTSGKHQSLSEAAFLGHQPSWSPLHHAGIAPCRFLTLSESPRSAPAHCSPNPGMCPSITGTLAWVSPSGLRTRPPSRAMLLPVGLHCLSTSVPDRTTPNFQGAVLLSNAAFNCNIFYFI